MSPSGGMRCAFPPYGAGTAGVPPATGTGGVPPPAREATHSRARTANRRNLPNRRRDAADPSGRQDAGGPIQTLSRASTPWRSACKTSVSLPKQGRYVGRHCPWWDELHVDGGVTAQLFFSPAGADWQRIAERLDARGKPQLYVIRNAQLRPRWQTVKRRLVPIMSRSIDTLIGAQSIGNLAELYIIAREQGLDYHLAYIPQHFSAVSKEPFDQDYMNKLFQLGHERALADRAWVRLDELD